MNKTVGLMVAVALLSGAAYADTAPATSTATESSLLDKISASYTAQATGPTLDGAVTGTKIEHIPSVKVKATDSLTAGLSAYFVTAPGALFTAGDPWGSVSGKIFSAGDFSLAGDVRVYAPISAGSQAASLLTGVRFTQSATYAIPSSRFTLGLVAFERINAFMEAKANKDGKHQKSFVLYVQPNVSFQLTPSVSLFAAVENVTFHRLHEAGVFSLTHDSWNVEPGVSWDITSKINLSGYVDINPEALKDGFLGASNVGAVLSASIL